MGSILCRHQRVSRRCFSCVIFVCYTVILHHFHPLPLQVCPNHSGVVMGDWMYQKQYLVCGMIHVLCLVFSSLGTAGRYRQLTHFNEGMCCLDAFFPHTPIMFLWEMSRYGVTTGKKFSYLCIILPSIGKAEDCVVGRSGCFFFLLLPSS